MFGDETEVQEPPLRTHFVPGARQTITGPSRVFAQCRRRLFGGRVGALRVGLWLLVLEVAFALIAPLFLVNPTHQNLAVTLASPSFAHPMGTDSLGRDIFAWTASGIRTGLIVIVGVIALSGAVGVLVGLICGYVRGPIDSLLMRLAELQLAIPPIILFIAVTSVVGNFNTIRLVLMMSSVSWIPYARLVRSRVLSERELAHVAAARLAGATRREILVCHLLPSTAALVGVFASTQAGTILLWETGLSFLGLGLQPPAISLGFMISSGQAYLSTAWWICVGPGVAIVILVLAVSLIGDGLSDALNIGEVRHP